MRHLGLVMLGVLGSQVFLYLYGAPSLLGRLIGLFH